MLKVLTENEVKFLMKLSETEREIRIKELEWSTELDFYETRLVIKKMRKEARNNKRPQMFSKLGEVQAHLDTFDPIIH